MEARGVTWSEEHRHRCEVRYCLRLAMQSSQQAAAYLNRVEDFSPERHARLKLDCRQQFDRGNRGEEGQWK